MENTKTMNIGKAGVTDAFIEELMTMMRKNKTVKIRALKSALEDAAIGETAREVASKTNTNLEDVRGHTFTLSKKK
ncbi:MAG: YhbY family RNA-binding protein [Candidatus Altiarchaeota archaeon]|nr:YhbY family RNA-binding protein [Candidatus Altiarchaeota archaeon]